MTHPSLPVPEDTLAALLDRVLDDETGIIRFLSIAAVQADEAPLFVGVAEMVDTHKLYPRRMTRESWQARAKEAANNASPSELPSGTVYSSGAALTREVALWSTVGEACERYAMNLQVQGIDVVGLADELPSAPIDPYALILYDDEQYSRGDFPFSRYDPSKKRFWTPAVNLVTGNKTFVPTELVAANYFDASMPLLDTVYSTGCAAGPNYARALFSGLCEVLERDAFMFYWLTATAPPRLDINLLRDELSPSLRALLDFPNIDLSLRWLRTDSGMPAVGCFIRPHNARGFASGASCNADWRLAVEKAIIEAFHTLNWIVDLDRWSDGPRSIESITDFPHHVRYYLEPEHHAGAGFLVQSDEPDATDEFMREYSVAKTYREAIAALNDRGYQPVAIDRTFEDLESVGICVTHVLVPGLQPLHVGTGIEHRDRRRLERLAAFLQTPMPDHLNLVPHPFP